MVYKNIKRLGARQLKARRRRLAHTLADAEGALQGSVVTQGRRCGKEGCRCALGELHGPYVYLALRRGRGESRMLYVPTDLADAVRDKVGLTARMEAALKEISDINLELLARRKLE
jgi:hypothetical protein